MLTKLTFKTPRSYAAILAFILFFVPLASAPLAQANVAYFIKTALPQQAAGAARDFTILPSSGVQGRDYEVVLAKTACPQAGTNLTFKDYDLYAPQGAGVRVSAVQAIGDCQLTARLNLASDAPVGKATLWLKPNASGLKKDSQLKVEPIEFEINGIAPGPIPPGLNNQGQVDVMWSVLPDSVVKDNFGGKVANEYYAIEVLIGNDTGFDIQIASVGFTAPTLFGNKIPATGYRITRGSLQRRQQLSPRNILINSLKVIGPFLTGFTPYFHNIPHRTNFSEAINIISNPLEKGLEFVIPDTTVDQLARLGDQAFRDDINTRTVIPNNTQSRILTFVAKDLIFPPTGKNALGRRQYNYTQTLTVTNTATGIQGFRAGSGGGGTYNPRNNPQDVMRLLGELVIVGDQIDHVNRIRVVNSQPEATGTDFSISGRLTDACNNGIAGVTVKLSGGADFATRTVTTSADGTYLFTNAPAGRNYTVTPESGDATFSPESQGLENFTLSDTRTNVNFRGDIKSFTITGKITKKASSDGVDGIVVNLTGQATATATTANGGVYKLTITGTPITGDFQITPVATADFTSFTPSARTWNCTHREVDFTATPKK